jgi:hypothetical protein
VLLEPAARSEPGQRIARTRALGQQTPERAGLLRNHGHALPLHLIEAADRIADRQQAVGSESNCSKCHHALSRNA